MSDFVSIHLEDADSKEGGILERRVEQQSVAELVALPVNTLMLRTLYSTRSQVFLLIMEILH